MDYFRLFAVLSIGLPILWSAYEAFKMRRHRMKTDVLIAVATSTIVNLDKRLTLAVQNDQAIAAKIAELSRRNPA